MLGNSGAAVVVVVVRTRPTSNIASQDNHEKINPWVSFIFPLHDEYGAPPGGPSSAIIVHFVT